MATYKVWLVQHCENEAMGFLDLLLAPAPDGAQRQYEALPSHTRKAVNSSRRVLHLSSRRGRFCVLSLFLLPFLLAVAFWVHTEALLNALKSPSEFLSLPPNYKSYYAAERDLPQHNLSLSFPEGENGRYMRVKERVWGNFLSSHLIRSKGSSYFRAGME